MPTYFDPNNLTTQQQANWDTAMATYERLRSTQDKSGAWNPPGHPKSALFARLLAGEPPLEAPPPTSFSYPWYEVIEKPGPFSVMVDPLPRRSVWARTALVINQCPWAIVRKNKPAKALHRLAEQLRQLDPASTPAQGLLTEALRVLADQPEWIVRYHTWPAYRVYVGRETRAARRDLVEARQTCDRDFTGGNPTITRLVATGQAQYERDVARRNAILKVPEAKRTGFDQLLLETPPPPSNPSAAQLRARDWVEYECDGFFLAKIDAS